MTASPILRAVLFDLDGTLVDSEAQTDLAIEEVMAAHGHEGVVLPPYETRGRSWHDIATTLSARHAPTATVARLVSELEEVWAAGIDSVPPIPGAPEAIRAATRHLRVAIVSSSPRFVIDRFAERLGVGDVVPGDARIGADQITRFKPDPEGFLLAAQRFGASPHECVVFEDSRAGLEAARQAGMFSVAVLYRCAEPEACRELATTTCRDYLALSPTFWQDLAHKGPHILED
jgi:beta-phosphoglucomutase-like phosphatase (HAD superfamily)